MKDPYERANWALAISNLIVGVGCFIAAAFLTGSEAGAQQLCFENRPGFMRVGTNPIKIQDNGQLNASTMDKADLSCNCELIAARQPNGQVQIEGWQRIWINYVCPDVGVCLNRQLACNHQYGVLFVGVPLATSVILPNGQKWWIDVISTVYASFPGQTQTPGYLLVPGCNLIPQGTILHMQGVVFFSASPVGNWKEVATPYIQGFVG